MNNKAKVGMTIFVTPVPFEIKPVVVLGPIWMISDVGAGNTAAGSTKIKAKKRKNNAMIVIGSITRFLIGIIPFEIDYACQSSTSIRLCFLIKSF